MTEVLKHIGNIVNTGKRCAVIFLQIPGKESHALVVDTEALPERMHDPLMGIIRSNDAQQAQNLGEVLKRRMMPDNNIDMLTELHQSGHLRPVPVTNINLTPRPNTNVLLSEVLVAMGRSIDSGEAVDIPEAVAETAQVMSGEEVVNEIAGDITTAIAQDDVEAARNLLVQADLMEQDVTKLREQAYAMAPELKPKTTTRKPAAKTTTKARTKKNEPAAKNPTTTNRSGKTKTA